MTRLIRAEIVKFVSLRVNLVLALVAVALVVAPTLALFASSRDFAHLVALRFIDDGSLVLLGLGVMAMASEFRHHTIAQTLILETRRSRVLLAKLITYALLGAVLAVLTSLGHLAALHAGVGVDGVELSVRTETLSRAYGGYVVGGALWSALGVAVGSLIVNLPAALAISFVWATVVEGAIRALWSAPGRYLPEASLAALAQSATQSEQLSQASAALMLSLYALALILAAALSLERRDIA